MAVDWDGDVVRVPWHGRFRSLGFARENIRGARENTQCAWEGIRGVRVTRAPPQRAPTRDAPTRGRRGRRPVSKEMLIRQLHGLSVLVIWPVWLRRILAHDPTGTRFAVCDLPGGPVLSGGWRERGEGAGTTGGGGGRSGGADVLRAAGVQQRVLERRPRAVAARFLDVFDGDGPIVVPSGSCGAMVKHHYAALFRDDPVTSSNGHVRLGKRLVRVFRVALRMFSARSDAMGRNSGQITYHACCHLLRELGIDEQPRALLDGVEGPELKPLERADVCCGFGGTFAVKMPDISTAMLDEKLDNVEATGAETLVAGDAGCIMHMAGGLRRRGSPVRVAHLAEYLDESMKNAGADPNAGS